MLKKLKEENEVLHGDETTMQCNKEKDKKASSKSYMWVIASGEEEKTKGVIFKYSRSRSGEIAQKLLKEYKGILVTDGYAGYNNLEEINRAECWAHARRYFYESVPLDENKQMIKTSDGYTGVKYIDELFQIEREIEKLRAEEKVQKRQEKSGKSCPIFLVDFRIFLNRYKAVFQEHIQDCLGHLVLHGFIRFFHLCALRLRPFFRAA